MKLALPRFVVLGFVALARCAPPSAAVPVTAAPIPSSGDAAIPYAVPVPAPHGERLVVSYGIVDIRSDANAAEGLRASHVRMILRNDNTRVWSVDVRDQRVAIERRGRSAPAFASTDAGSALPVLTIAPGTSRTIDLFFPLPADMQQATVLPRFSAVSWLGIGDEVAIERQPADRLLARPEKYRAYDYGPDHWDPPYWYNPFYPDFSFIGGAGVPAALVKHPVTIRLAPSAANE